MQKREQGRSGSWRRRRRGVRVAVAHDAREFRGRPSDRQAHPARGWRKGLQTLRNALLGVGFGVWAGGAAADPWLLDEALGLPAWLQLAGESRIRFESLDGQFRAGGSGGDQLLAWRTLLLAEAVVGPTTFGLELQDARAWLDDAGTPLSTAFVNPTDVLQAYVRVRLPGAGSPPAATEITLGRQLLAIGSGRHIDRFEFANAISGFTGVRVRSLSSAGHERHAFYVVPVERRPTDRDRLGENRAEHDREAWGRRFWGLHYRHAELLGTALPRLWTEAYLYGLDERDRGSVQTANRRYLTPGVRVQRVPQPGAWDLEVEAAYRFGARRRTSNPADRDDLDVGAWMAYAALGYTFSRRSRPRLALEYYQASGDADPDDGRYDRYDYLFGGRRTDLGHTSLFGPLMPSNVRAPGLRVEFRPDTRLDGRLVWKAAWLDRPRDAWVAAGVQDPAGDSGRFIGHLVDGRIRYWMIPSTLRLELGGSALRRGRFAKAAPNAARAGDTAYGYLQFTVYY